MLVLEILQVLLSVGQLFLVPSIISLGLLQRVARYVRNQFLRHMLHEEVVQLGCHLVSFGGRSLLPLIRLHGLAMIGWIYWLLSFSGW